MIHGSAQAIRVTGSYNMDQDKLCRNRQPSTSETIRNMQKKGGNFNSLLSTSLAV